ncbi:Mth938-like domain-containing protein [Sulfuriflexus mobilis]|uniref:Mth938-like domain-containing protein n=1 Tax=Sulfuriflexus mobilis TaxID=1811807 RepID=UPI0015590ED4|nr:Mth938-like domain-containing protein [Sulfuriflexus mobilis]
MKLHQHSRAEHYAIRAYTDTSITINDEVFTRPLLVTADILLPDWAVTGFDALQASHFNALNALDIQILLLGTGRQQRFPSPRLLLGLQERAIGTEVMSTPAACRTYNILLAEGRSVAAALLIE